jgi:hypothetical protein
MTIEKLEGDKVAVSPEAMQALAEQSGADERQSLMDVVIAHCDDLDRAAPVLREYNLIVTAVEFERASEAVKS